MKWQAKWIWLEQAGLNPTTSLLVRKEFSVDKHPALAQLAISANNIYRFYINCASIGPSRDRADPLFPYFDSYEVTPHLRAGKKER